MTTKRALGLLGFIMLAVLFGCAGGGGGGDDDNPANRLTMANLQGIYDLNAAQSIIGDFTDGTAVVALGELEVQANMLVLAVTGTTTETFVIADAQTLTLTEADGDMVSLQTTFTDNGATLTFVEDDGDRLVFVRRGAANSNALTEDNLQGTYDLDVAGSSPLSFDDDDRVITAFVLDVMGMMLTLTATSELTATYVITDSLTLTFTDDNGDVDELEAILSDNGTVLTLIEADGDRLVFEQR